MQINLALIMYKDGGDKKVSIDKTGNLRVTYYWGAFVQPLLRWKNNQ